VFRSGGHGDVIVTIKNEEVDVAVTKPEAAFYDDAGSCPTDPARSPIAAKVYALSTEDVPVKLA
jgi:hypothetical protein